MSLSDPLYFLFLAIVFLLFYLLRPGEPRRILLLTSSYFFYFELSGLYILILFFVTLVTYFGTKLLRTPKWKNSGFVLFLAIVLLLTPLLVFRYIIVFLSPSLRESLMLVAFPIGISFFTFAALGYLIDVYLEVVEPEPSPTRVALFLAFFPLVSAGPIERSGRFMTQFGFDLPFMSDRALLALRLILVGLLMKIVLANVLAVPVNTVYDHLTTSSALEQMCAVLYYPFYLYADFAGYSLIAIGSAKLFGLEVRPNFQQPFFSTTIPEFWRNWHISLSSWVRDYLFSPMRMELRRFGNGGMALALLLSFVILGVWHGAKVGFFCFGLMHGCYAVASLFTLPWRNRMATRLRIPGIVVQTSRCIGTFFLATIAFVVFRADTMQQTLSIYLNLFSTTPFREFHAVILALLHHENVDSLGQLKQFFGVFWIIPFILLGDLFARKEIRFESLPPILQAIGYNSSLLFIVAYWLTHYGSQPFVYYKF